MGLDLRAAQALVEAARVEVGSGAPLAMDVVDRHGHTLAFVRMDEAMLAASHTVPARTALYLAEPTTPFVHRAAGEPVEVLSVCRAAGLVVSAGAIPLSDATGIAGAVGASGGRAAEDERASEAGASAWRRRVAGR